MKYRELRIARSERGWMVMGLREDTRVWVQLVTGFKSAEVAIRVIAAMNKRNVPVRGM